MQGVLNVNGKKIVKLGFTGPRVGLALKVAEALEAQNIESAEILKLLSGIKTAPESGLDHPLYRELAVSEVAEQQKREVSQSDRLRETPLTYGIWGETLIDPGARAQMDVAMRLPISIAGALMPDAHVGYGLPIGGVLATRGAVIPYGVGVDIGCSMQLSIFPWDEISKDEKVQLLNQHTRFGAGVGWEKRYWVEHPVLDEATWSEQALLRKLHEKAVEQLGTSGSGNHFVEFGVFELSEADLGLESGRYLALLSHSGSRGMGAQVAGHFTKIAEKLHPHLDPKAKKLAWLDLESEEGQAYWQAMELAGRYALANHEVIHMRFSNALKIKPLAKVSNSHNLAWRERWEGEEVIVHRKGATPAAEGQLGIIPGSMADCGYVIRGKGHAQALFSASHGAGRQLGRKQAEQTLSPKDVKQILASRGITLIGGGIDEAPQAYKPIDEVMNAQTDLVDRIGRFTPQVVRMDS